MSQVCRNPPLTHIKFVWPEPSKTYSEQCQHLSVTIRFVLEKVTLQLGPQATVRGPLESVSNQPWEAEGLVRVSAVKMN